VDILVAGVLFSSEAVGDYAIAARIATLFTFFEIAMLKRFAPRAGALIEAGDMAALRAETATCRRLVIAAGCLTICGVLISAPFVFPLFGNFSGAIVFLTWLAIPAFVSAFYATSDRLLVIAGQANVSLVLNASGFAMLVTAPFLIAPWLGVVALPAAMIASALLFNPIVSARARHLFDVATITPLDIGLIAFGSVALAASALYRTPLSVAAACAALVLVALYMIWTAMRQPRAAAD
jgi:O-antigen/teichoic acid export membrane protein